MEPPNKYIAVRSVLVPCSKCGDMVKRSEYHTGTVTCVHCKSHALKRKLYETTEEETRIPMEGHVWIGKTQVPIEKTVTCYFCKYNRVKKTKRTGDFPVCRDCGKTVHSRSPRQKYKAP